MDLITINNVSEFDNIKKFEGLLVLHFMADWAPQCTQMNDVMIELTNQKDLSAVKFSKIMAEDVPEVSEGFGISAVPTVLLLRQGKVLDRVDGANAADLTAKVKAQAAKAALLSMTPALAQEDLNSRLKRLINASRCVLFMKGSPDEPKCGFSKRTVEMLNKRQAEFSHFDILNDDSVRQGLKTYSNWPTYPQLYVDGELIGGLDILQEMDAAGELEAALPKKAEAEIVRTKDEGVSEQRLSALVRRSQLMVFMKGSPQQARCGFSKQLVAILAETGLQYDTFDILSDEPVRQALKTFSNWPTYPQIYVNGELIGGLDIIKEMQADGSLKEALIKAE